MTGHHHHEVQGRRVVVPSVDGGIRSPPRETWTRSCLPMSSMTATPSSLKMGNGEEAAAGVALVAITARL